MDSTMARNQGKKALYEVMSKARAKQGYEKALEQIHLEKTEEAKPAVKQLKPDAEKAEAAADWWKKPRIAQFNAGRFEFSVPYQVAIVLGLVLVLVVLASYRLGQNSVVPGQLAIDEPGQDVEKIDQGNDAELATANMAEAASPVEYAPPKLDVPPFEDVTQYVEKEVEPVKPKGKNAIVLAYSGKVGDLQPVVAHFALYGIALQIDPLNDGKYLLRTVEQFESRPAEPGTDGFRVKSEIIRVGPLYKGLAPAGLDTFAPHYFTDAYGKNVED